MKKLSTLLLSTVSILISISLVFAGQMYTQSITNSTGSSPFLAAQNTTMYSQSFPLKSGDTFAVGYQVVSAGGTPDVSMYLEQSFRLPVTEGSSDVNYTVPVSMANISRNLTAETWYFQALAPVAMPYGRVKIIDHANSTDTNITLKLSVIE